MGWVLTIAGGVVVALGLLLGIIAPTDRMTSIEAFFARLVIMLPTVLFGLVLIGLGHVSRQIAALKSTLALSTIGSVLAAAATPPPAAPPAAAPAAGPAPLLAAGAAGAAVAGAAVLAATQVAPVEAAPAPEPPAPAPEPASVLDRFDLELERRLAASLEGPIDLTPEPVAPLLALVEPEPPLDPEPVVEARADDEPVIPDAYLPAEPEPVLDLAVAVPVEPAPEPTPEPAPEPIIPPLPAVDAHAFGMPSSERPRPPTVAEYVAADEAALTEPAVPARQVVREGQFAGRRYRMFEDGSLEIDTDQSTLRFDSLDEFRAFVATGSKAPAG